LGEGRGGGELQAKREEQSKRRKFINKLTNKKKQEEYKSINIRHISFKKWLFDITTQKKRKKLVFKPMFLTPGNFHSNHHRSSPKSF